MKIFEALEQFERLKGNAFEEVDEIKWLSTVDSMVKRLVIDKHDGFENVNFSGYDLNTDRKTVLLVPEPFDDLYVLYMAAQADLYDREFTGYNNYILQFTAEYDRYAAWYNQQNRPNGPQVQFF